MSCKACGHENPEGSDFCNRCGASLATGEFPGDVKVQDSAVSGTVAMGGGKAIKGEIINIYTDGKRKGKAEAGEWKDETPPARMIIRRRKRIYGMLNKIRVEMDGEPLGELTVDWPIEVRVSPGLHRLRFSSTPMKKDLSLDVVSGQTVVMESYIKGIRIAVERVEG